MFVLAAFAVASCEPHCAHPCAELNGDLGIECGDCLPSSSCHPGAPGFTTWRGQQAARTRSSSGGMGTGMGLGSKAGSGTQQMSVQSASGATNLFRQPDAPLLDASLFSADATPEDEAAASASGGSDSSCESAACARVRLQWLRGANARKSPPGANVTAGGESVPCEFQVASSAELLAMSLTERADFLTRLPTLIRGLTDEWPARAAWSDPQSFSARFGHHELKAIRASRGFTRLARLGGPRCFHFDEAACPGQANATVALAELVPYSDEEQMVIMDLPGMSRGEYDLLADLTTEYEPPEFLLALSNVRLLSLGGRAEGVQMSRHHSAWLATVAGAKLWHVAPPHVSQPQNRYCVHRGKVDYGLAAREGILHCMAHEGDVVVVPDDWWHATCNMLPYTLAIGGQTWDQAAGTPFGARSEAERAATAARWKAGRPRPLNHFQHSIVDDLVEGERLPSGLASGSVGRGQL